MKNIWFYTIAVLFDRQLTPKVNRCLHMDIQYSTFDIGSRDLHGPYFVGPARRLHGPARGPEFEFRAWPVSARGIAKPGPARSGPTKAVSMGFLETIQFN